MAKMILVTGGARSGKSSFAEALVAKAGRRIAYIATAQIFDEEMNYRVKLHRQRRPASWQTYEAPFEAEKALLEAGRLHDAILFDCVTIYLSNLLCKPGERTEEEEYENVRQAMAQLTAAVRQMPAEATVVFVTNEVGAGIVPKNALARRYRDLAGLANQQLAQAADDVYAVICGLPLQLK